MSNLNEEYTNLFVLSNGSSRKRSRREPNKLVVINEEELIRQVEMHPILYDKSLKGYRKSALRRQYWNEIATNVDASVEECRRRWRSLRDAFSKHYKQMNRINSSEIIYKRKKWIFFDQMSFIAPYLDNSSLEIDETLLEDLHDNSSEATILLHHNDAELITNITDVVADISQSPFGNSRLNSASDQEAAENQHQPQISIINSNQTSSSSSTSLTTATTTTPTMTDEVSLKNQFTSGMFDISNSSTTNHVGKASIPDSGGGGGGGTNKFQEDNDSDVKFLLSCSPILKRLTRRKNALARLKIQQILYNIEFETD